MSELSMLLTEALDEIGYPLFAIALTAAYLIGNLSPATIISKASGVNIRKEGSGNPGTTNMLRVMGKKAAFLTLIIDILKGAAAVFLGRHIGGEAVSVLCGLAVFAGHVMPVLYGFKGGKGIATAFGVILTLNPLMGVISLAIAALGFAAAKRVSVGSLIAAVSLPILARMLMPDYIFIFGIMAAIVIVKHRSNVRRILKGEEPKINFNKKD